MKMGQVSLSPLSLLFPSLSSSLSPIKQPHDVGCSRELELWRYQPAVRHNSVMTELGQIEAKHAWRLKSILPKEMEVE